MFGSPSQSVSPSRTLSLGHAIRTFQSGKPVLVYDFDDREGEVDLIFPAEAVEPEDVAQMRNDAGGLICVAVSHEVAEHLNLPFLADEIDHSTSHAINLDYDDRSSFSLPVNHRDTRTGITDIDRALTISKIGEISRRPVAEKFNTEFRCPGHVNMLKAAPGLLEDRVGHTELGVSLAIKAGCAPAAVVCEMLDDESGEALSVNDAKWYASRHGLPFINGDDLVSCLPGQSYTINKDSIG